jgi:hypothetical protein
VPISLTLGQHPAPDPTVSFYAATPAGFDFEIGAGGGLVHEDWIPGSAGASTRGHRPTLRLKWQTLRAIRRHRSRARDPRCPRRRRREQLSTRGCKRPTEMEAHFLARCPIRALLLSHLD